MCCRLNLNKRLRSPQQDQGLEDWKNEEQYSSSQDQCKNRNRGREKNERIEL